MIIFSKLVFVFLAVVGLASSQLEAGKYGYGSISSKTGRATTTKVSGYYKTTAHTLTRTGEANSFLTQGAP